jgi:hypothetical protein
MKQTVKMWQRVGNLEQEIACDYFYSFFYGSYTSVRGPFYYTGEIRYV